MHAPPPVVGPARSLGGYLLQVTVLALLFGGSAQLAIHLSMFHGASPLLWPPIGVGLAGLLLLGPRAWPGVLLGAFLGNWFDHYPTITLVTLLASNLTATLVPTLLLRRLGMRISLERLSDVLLLLGGMLLSSVLTVLGGMLALRLGYSHAQVTDVVLFVIWSLATLSGLALITPFFLVWLGPRPSLPAPGRLIEAAGMTAALLLTVLAIRAALPGYALTAFPLLAWAGLRFGQRGAVTCSLGVFGLSMFATAVGEPALPVQTVMAQSVFFTAFHLSSSFTALLLAGTASDRRRARQDGRQVDLAYHALIDASPLAIIATDLEGRVTVWNRAADRLFGWKEEEVKGRVPPHVPPEYREDFFLRSSRPDQLPVQGKETVRVRRDGSRVDVVLSDWPLFDEEGQFSGGMAALLDISERKQAERLQSATWHISQAALAAPDLLELYTAIHGIIGDLMPARNCYIALHDPATGMLSFPYWADEAEPAPSARPMRNGCTDWVIRHGQTLHLRQAMADGFFEREAAELIGAPPVDWLGVPLLVNGRPIGALAVQTYQATDQYGPLERSILEFVSSQVAMAVERKRAEQAIRASEEELRALFAAMRDVILVLDREGRYLKVAPTRPDLLAAPAEVILGRTLHEVFPRERADEFLGAIRETLETQQPITFEYALPVGGGETWFRTTVSPVDADTVIWVARSIQEQRSAEQALERSEEQLRQAAKMEAVGRLAGGVAHDFNNLLTSVLGHADLALARLAPGEPLHDDLLEIRAAGARAAALTQQLLAFSRKQVLEPRVLDLNAVVTGIARMLRRTIGEDITLVTRLAPDLGPVRADPVQMEQVLVNLAVNARDAMPNGGKLTMETMNLLAASGPMVRIRVEDEGVGMSEEVRAHLFEPFFTTKEVGKGTGLGLATAYGIVQQSGGTIGVTSALGRGTCFLVDLPQVSGEPVSPSSAPRLGGDEGTETVLLVEDEEAVRNLTRRVLELYGYHVLSAPTGESALELSRLHPGTIDLLLTDVVMPGMSGPGLAEILVPERPGMRCMFMSGYAATTLEGKMLLGDEVSFLQKPFTTIELVRRVRDLLDGRPAPAAE